MRCSERDRIVQHLEPLCTLLLLLLLLLCVCQMHCCVWMYHTLRAGHLEEDERQRANALQALQNNVYTALQVYCPPLVCPSTAALAGQNVVCATASSISLLIAAVQYHYLLLQTQSGSEAELKGLESTIGRLEANLSSMQASSQSALDQVHGRLAECNHRFRLTGTTSSLAECKQLPTETYRS